MKGAASEVTQWRHQRLSSQLSVAADSGDIRSSALSSQMAAASWILVLNLPFS